MTRIWARSDSGAVSQRGVAIAVGGALIATIVAFGLAFVNSASARTVAQSSRQLQWANTTSGSAAIARAALHQALVFAVDEQLGVATDEAGAIALGEARSALASLGQWTTATPAPLEDDRQELDALHRAGLTIVTHIEAGEIVEADRVLTDEFETRYQLAKETLAGIQESFAAEIRKAESDAGRVERLTQLLVTLLIPAAAMVVYRLIVRRQYRDQRIQMETLLGAERELNAAKDRFIAGLSHELRTPLTSIYGFSEHLLDHGLLDPVEAIELITLINHDSAELTRMVEDLLVAARLESDTLPLETTAFDLESVAKEAVRQVERDGYSAEVSTAPVNALADRSAVSHVVRNLLSNACRYGGERIRVVVDEDDGMAVIGIWDDGPGIPNDLRERMFERFLNEGDRTLLNGSLGLGLSVAHSLALEMGGALHYERDAGHTVFTLSLPRAEEVRAAPDAPSGQLALAATKGPVP